MLQHTLILIKPDGVERGLIGECIKRCEQRGLKIVGLKMVWPDEDRAKTHYGDDIVKRRGEAVRDSLVKYVTAGPIVAMVIEGINAVENVRKIVGPTEPKEAHPGTIRGDFAHVSFAHADNQEIAVKNLIHASGNEEEAKTEIDIWFHKEEVHSYDGVHDKHIKH